MSFNTSFNSIRFGGPNQIQLREPVVSTPGSSGPTGPPGAAGGTGLTLYLNYSETPIIPETALTGSDLPSPLVDPQSSPSPTPLPSDPTSIRNLSQYLSSASQTELNIDLSPLTEDQVCAQFGVFLSEIGNPLFISQGIWTLQLFAHEDIGGGDVTVNFELYAYNSSNPFTGANLTQISSESAQITVDTVSPQIGHYEIDLAVPYFDLTPYDMIYLVIAGYNTDSNTHILSLYFESPPTYGHLHTTIATGQPCYGEMYALSGSLSIPSAGPYYGLSGMTGVYSNKVSIAQSPSGTTMLPRVTDIYNVSFGINGSSSNPTTTISQSIFVNNTIAPKFKSVCYYNGANQSATSSSNGLLYLVDGDVVTLRFSSDTPTDFQIDNVNLTIQEMGLN